MSCEKLCAKMWRLKMGLGCGSLAGCLAAWFGDENMSSEAQAYTSFGIWHLRQKEFCSDPAGTQNSKLGDWKILKDIDRYWKGYGSIPIDTFLVGWTSIYRLFWGSLGTRVLTHPQKCWKRLKVCFPLPSVVSRSTPCNYRSACACRCSTGSWIVEILWIWILREPVLSGFRDNVWYRIWMRRKPLGNTRREYSRIFMPCLPADRFMMIYECRLIDMIDRQIASCHPLTPLKPHKPGQSPSSSPTAHHHHPKFPAKIPSLLQLSAETMTLVDLQHLQSNGLWVDSLLVTCNVSNVNFNTWQMVLHEAKETFLLAHASLQQEYPFRRIWWNLMHFPYAPCMVYLPTFGWFLGQMLVNIPYMEHMGLN